MYRKGDHMSGQLSDPRTGTDLNHQIDVRVSALSELSEA
jgi:hypothetical protein